MSAEIIPLRRRDNRRGWRADAAEDPLGTIEDWHPRFVTYLRAKPRSPRTIARYLEHSGAFSAWLGRPDLRQIKRADVEQWVATRLAAGAKGSTVYTNWVSVKQFFEFLAEQDDVEQWTPPTDGMTPPRFEEPLIEVPPGQLLADMVTQTHKQRDRYGNRPFEAIRDEAMLRIFIETGARLDEVTSLKVHDNLGDTLRVWGKSKGGGKVERHLAISTRTQTALRKYLRQRAMHPQADSDQLFLGKKGRFTANGVRQMVWRRSLSCGQRIHPHQLRHYAAHKWKSDPTQSDSDLMEVMGWRSDAMLRRYGKSVAQERALKAHRRFVEEG